MGASVKKMIHLNSRTISLLFISLYFSNLILFLVGCSGVNKMVIKSVQHCTGSGMIGCVKGKYLIYKAGMFDSYKIGTGDVPLDAIKHGLTNFAGLSPDECKYFHEIANLIKIGLTKEGRIIANIVCPRPLYLQVMLHPSFSELEMTITNNNFTNKTYAIRLNE